MNEPKVSVVMATYAGDNLTHLQAAIESILNQDHPIIELIVVIDGKVSDERRQFFSDVQSKGNVLVLQHEINRGPAYSRNVGIKAASGTYIAVMDADDVSKPDRISRQLKFLVEHDLDISSSDLEIIDESGKVIGSRTLPSCHEEISSLIPYRCPLHNPSLFCKAAVLRDNMYDPSFRVGEDYELWVRLMLAGYRFGNTKYCCVSYRQSVTALAKRTGLSYAFSDLKIKLATLPLVSRSGKPIVVSTAICAALARLFPVWLFRKIYGRRENLFRHLTAAVAEKNYGRGRS